MLGSGRSHFRSHSPRSIDRTKKRRECYTVHSLASRKEAEARTSCAGLRACWALSRELESFPLKRWLDTVRKEGMSRATLANRKATSPGPAPSVAARRIVPRDVLILAAWCGLAAGLLEVGARILCRCINPTGRLYQVGRHFVWLAPLTYLLLFFAMGLFLAAVTRLWPRRGGWLSRRLIVACALMPGLVVASPQIYASAWMILALGIASRLVALLERHSSGLRSWLLWSFPGLLGLVLVMACSVFAGY